jgi:hypothetical protein
MLEGLQGTDPPDGSELAVELGLGIARIRAAAAVGAIGPGVAGDAVVIPSAIQIVVPIAARDDVVSEIPPEDFLVVSAVDQVRAYSTIGEIVIGAGRASEDLVVPDAPIETVGIPFAIKTVVGFVSIKQVAAVAPVDTVCGRGSGQVVIPRGSIDRVRTGARGPGRRGEGQGSGQDE